MPKPPDEPPEGWRRIGSTRCGVPVFVPANGRLRHTVFADCDAFVA